jgi:integrase/recombinase XerD
MPRKRLGYKATENLRKRTHEQRGGSDKTEDGLDRSPGTLAAAALLFQRHLHTIQAGKLSIKSRIAELRPFLLWAQERDLTRPDQITRSILESYQRHLLTLRKTNGHPLSVTTHRHRLQIIQVYFAWLCRERILEANPASELILPKRQQRLPEQPLSLQEIDTLLGVPDITDPLGLRDRAIIELFYSTGIRRAELCALTLTDVRHDRQILFVRLGKGGKDRVVPLGSRAMRWLNTYLDRSRPKLQLNPNETALFLSSYGEPYTPGAMSRLIRGYLMQSGLTRPGSCHLLRHTCATHMLEGGADVRYVQELLGHAKLDTTAIYTRVSIQTLAAVHARCHPAERPRQEP